MAKLQVRLLVLIALGTISWCEEVRGSLPESVAVIASRSGAPPLGCGPKTVNVRFNAIKLKGPDSDVVYHQVTVRDVHIEFAMNSSVSLPSNSLFECGKAAAGAGMDAFAFNGNCTGYLLNSHFLRCQTGDVVVYVQPDFVIEEPVVVPLDEAPFKSLEQNRRQYMLSILVNNDGDLPGLLDTKTVPFDLYYMVYDLLYRENGDTFFLNGFFVDVDFCLSDGAYGLLLDVRQALYDSFGEVKYFFEECGNTVQVRPYRYPGNLIVLSHPGFGCKYYPTDLPDECTVTFEPEDSGVLTAGFGFYFSETDADDGGLNMTITGENPDTGALEHRNMYQKNSPQNFEGYQSTVKVTLLRQPSKRAIGFIVGLTKIDFFG